MAASLRSAAWRAGTCTLQPIRCRSRSSPPGCRSRRTGGAPPGRCGPASSTGPHPIPRQPGLLPAPPPAHAPAPGPACTGHHQGLLTSAPPGHPRPAPAATGSPTSASPGSVLRPPGRWPRPRSGQPPLTAPAPGGPAQPRSAHHHRDTSCPRRSTTRRPAPAFVTSGIKDLLDDVQGAAGRRVLHPSVAFCRFSAFTIPLRDALSSRDRLNYE
jgi:hypothetical protein